MLRRLSMLVALVAAAVAAPSALAEPSELFISEYVEGSSNNKALEIFNGTAAPITLTNVYDVQMCFNGSSTCTLTIPLTGTVAPDDVFVLAHAQAVAAILGQADQTNASGWFNGNDAVLLRKNGVVIDSIGQVGVDPGTQWGSGLTSTMDNTLRRKLSIESGDANPMDAFDPAVEWDGFANDTFNGLGFHGLPRPSVTCGGPLTLLEGTAGTRAVSATDLDGTVTTLTIDSVTPAPAAGSITMTNVVPATTVGGTATATVAVSDSLPPGSYAVVVGATNSDDPAQSGSCTLTVNVTDIKTIGEVQGTTLDSENGATDRSPFAPPTGGGNGAVVVVRGVITQKTLARLVNGTPQRGFFLQSTPASTDGNPLSSDGIFVFMDRFEDLIGGYVPEVGDEILLQGTVQEDFNFTRLRNASLVAELGSFLDLDAVAPEFVAGPPDDLADANRYWERREGMRGRVEAGAVTVDGLDVFPSTFDGEQWLIRGDHPVAQRSAPFARRVFRDPHPLDNVPGSLFDDGNGYRIMIASLGVKQTAGNTDTLLTPARTFETLQNDLVGGVYFSFAKYSLQVAQQPQYTLGVDPSTNAPPAAFDRFRAHSVADYNVENLYDYRDDPFDGCDFAGNTGCPGINPPFDYVPASDAVYQARLGEIATQIVEDLHAPDLLLAQEAEDQDICTVTAATLDCGTTDNRDGKPDTLQELALRIGADHGVAYDAAYDRDGSDDRGIVSGFLYRSNRVQLLPVTAAHAVLGSSPTVQYSAPGLPYNTQVSNPKALNADLPPNTPGPTDGNDVYTRDPQVGYFRIWRTAIGVGGWVDLYAIAEHFSSTPDSRVAQRREQSRYTGAIVNALASAPDGARVVAGGDFNVYPRPDDPFPPPATSDQLGPLYDEAGMTNLFDVLVAEVPSAAYSYVFQGQTQTLDGQFVTDALFGELESARAAHVNADFPADTPGDGARGLSDHDPLVARYELVATLAGLKELLSYYGETGQITGTNTLRQLQQHLDRGQIREFIGQVRDKTPRFVTPVASAALIAEAELLLE
jgi:predicted extracellular nuclease